MGDQIDMPLNKFIFEVYGDGTENDPIEFKICNISSFVFYSI